MLMMAPKVLVMASMGIFCNLHNSSCKSLLMKLIKIKIYLLKLLERGIKLLFCNNRALYNELKLSFQQEHLFNTLYLQNHPNIQVAKPSRVGMTNIWHISS